MAVCLASLGLATSLVSPALAQDDQVVSDRLYWDLILDIEGRFSTGRNIGQGDLFVPLTQLRDQLVFADFRFRYDDDASQEYNLGVGYRRLLGDKVILGGYGYFDHLISGNDNGFNQLTFGAEALLEHFEFRGNLYLPEDDEKGFGPSFASGQLLGGTLSYNTNQQVEKPLPGFDLEAGVRSPVREIDAWIYAGYFRFDDSGFETVAGPQVRAQWNIDTDAILPNSTLSTGVRWAEDDVRGSRTYFTIGIRFPLGFGGRPGGVTTPLPDWQPDRMVRRVERDIDIVTGARAAVVSSEPATIPGTGGTPFGTIDVVRDGGTAATGTGTLQNPSGDLVASIDSGAEIVILAGRRNDANQLIPYELAPGQSLNLNPGQSLLGGGSAIQITDASGNNPVTYFVPAFRGVVRQNDIFTDIINANDDTEIQRMYLVEGSSGIVIDDADNVSVFDTTIFGPSGDGVQIINGSTGVSIIAFGVQDEAGSGTIAGIRITGNTTSDVLLENLDLRSLPNQGIVIENQASAVTINRLDLNGTTGSTVGLSIDNASDVTVDGAVIRTFDSSAVAVTNASSNINIDDLITVGPGNAAAAVLIDNASGVTLTNPLIYDFANNGLEITNGSSDITVDSLRTRGGADSDTAIQLTGVSDITLTNSALLDFVAEDGAPPATPVTANRLLQATNVTDLTVDQFYATGFVGGASVADPDPDNDTNDYALGEIFDLDNVDDSTFANLDFDGVRVTSINNTPDSFDGVIVIRNGSENLTFTGATDPDDRSVIRTLGQLAGSMVRVTDSGNVTPITFTNFTFDLADNFEAADLPGNGTHLSVGNATVSFDNTIFRTNRDDNNDFIFYDTASGNTVDLSGTGNTFVNTELENATPSVSNGATTVNGGIDFDEPEGTLDGTGFTPAP
ncbi:inverse autotransporter beta domain-containing protein [Mucisphaera calidilacus]|nr:inverse autotransporter beta domain-containing protein [Mucisphaera calidilacus]